jgi:hypothetical protein
VAPALGAPEFGANAAAHAKRQISTIPTSHQHSKERKMRIRQRLARLHRFVVAAVDRIGGRNVDTRLTAGGVDHGTQLTLVLAYQEQARARRVLPEFADVEFRNNSQNGEDGILLFIFALAGMGDRRAVEMCASDGIECNTANLVLHHGWEALMLDGSKDLIERGKRFYRSHPETSRLGPTLEAVWIDRENAEAVLRRHNFVDNLDLLSLDMDGNDYWVLERLKIRPRVVVCEYNNRIPAGEALTVPYVENFVAADDRTHGEGFFGASLDAYVALLANRGYRLVGANRHNTNAFFLRDDELADLLPAVPVAACLQSAWARHQQHSWWPHLQTRPWVRL